MNLLITPLFAELDIFFAFSWRDWSTTIIPGSIWGVGAAVTSQRPLPTALFPFPRLLIWLTLFIYIFTLTNQIVGVDEDRLNKPDRPIPSGKVTLASARARAIVVLAAFLGIAMISPSVLPESIGWVLMTGFLCFTAAGNHWFGKNMIGMTAGTWALLSGAWKLIHPCTPQTRDHIVGTALWFGLSLNLQDLRDFAGDLATGRKTLPIVYGNLLARKIIAFFLIPSAMAVLWWWNILSIAPASLTIAHVVLGYRVMHSAGGPRYDHKTFMFHTYIFCFIIACLALPDFLPAVNILHLF
ncbi:UbiA prenyltransferase family [Mycena maculata]|uniref:UbiA prenyltransferase family n=1 Tax=Mycena maculata TaxID=230809 RepID=A0AAD7N425_9AGAR|nr:UbiA prenyltransferase family [Mycena maculata]